MPGVNQAVFASAGVIAIMMAAAAAIAVYESPELRRRADELRRRIAIALHSLGDGVQPPSREPLFNRPEDAEGFLRSRGPLASETGVDADEETRRRQRDELMYWNAVREEKMKKEKAKAEPADASPRTLERATTFDDFLQQDSGAERGTYVFNTGADIHRANEGLSRRRGGGRHEGVRGLDAAIYADPFADENGVDDFYDEKATWEPHPLSPCEDEVMSDDIYNATEPAASRTLSPETTPEKLIDLDTQQPLPLRPEPAGQNGAAQDYSMTSDAEDRHDTYASIQAWAQASNSGFYSPLPVTPSAPLSEPEVISEGGAPTPTDSVSQADSGERIDIDAASSHAGEGDSSYDVISESDDGTRTPVSWSEVGSVVSESESMGHR